MLVVEFYDHCYAEILYIYLVNYLVLHGGKKFRKNYRNAEKNSDKHAQNIKYILRTGADVIVINTLIRKAENL